MLRKIFISTVHNFLFPLLAMAIIFGAFVFVCFLAFSLFSLVPNFSFFVISILFFIFVTRYFYKKARGTYSVTKIGQRNYSKELSWKKTF